MRFLQLILLVLGLNLPLRVVCLVFLFCSHLLLASHYSSVFFGSSLVLGLTLLCRAFRLLSLCCCRLLLVTHYPAPLRVLK
jgi:hypothetical protein